MLIEFWENVIALIASLFALIMSVLKIYEKWLQIKKLRQELKDK